MPRTDYSSRQVVYRRCCAKRGCSPVACPTSPLSMMSFVCDYMEFDFSVFSVPSVVKKPIQPQRTQRKPKPMPRRPSLALAFLLFIVLSIQSDAIVRPIVAVAQSKPVPAPEDVIGFRPGDDRKLASWAQVIEYFQKLDAASERVKFEEIGKSTM